MNNLIDVSHTDMMSEDQVQIVKSVYNRFLSCEEGSVWSNLDEMMEYFEFLTDGEMITEATLRMQMHIQMGIKCSNDHPIQDCFAPIILEAVEAIVELYSKTKSLHLKNRYVLAYYLTLSELRLILALNES